MNLTPKTTLTVESQTIDFASDLLVFVNIEFDVDEPLLIIASDEIVFLNIHFDFVETRLIVITVRLIVASDESALGNI